MRKPRFFGRRRKGFTIIETVIASTGVLLTLAVAVPAFKSAGDAGDEGAARVRVQAETRHALFRLARELENSSMTAVDEDGAFRLAVTQGEVPDAIVDDRYSADPFLYMGGFTGRLGDDRNLANSNADDDSDDKVLGLAAGGTVDAAESIAKGSGARMGTHIGRTRLASFDASDEISTNSLRPRHAQILLNSVLTFEVVTGYTVDADGQPVVNWSSPIEYRVENRHLVRVQGASKRIVCPTCIGFQVQPTDSGTLLITIVSQTRSHATGRIVADANQIEVSPKN
jgi:hypothetical protein